MTGHGKSLEYYSGGGLVFGPYAIDNRPYNAVEYVRLLEEEVFPEIRAVLGEQEWARAIWMQVCYMLRIHTTCVPLDLNFVLLKLDLHNSCSIGYKRCAIGIGPN